MNHRKAVVKLYNYFYSKIYKTPFSLDLSQAKQEKMVDNFIKLLANQLGLHSIGINTFIDIFSFSFAYWNTKATKRRISLNWIIGKKTVTRWLEKKDGQNFYTDKFLLEYGIDLSLLKQQLYELENKELTSQGLDPAEELEKLRFEGEAKLYNCLQHTTLYHHRSLNCLGCSNRSVCKGLLRTTAPQVYKRRGYSKIE